MVGGLILKLMLKKYGVRAQTGCSWWKIDPRDTNGEFVNSLVTISFSLCLMGVVNLARPSDIYTYDLLKQSFILLIVYMSFL